MMIVWMFIGASPGSTGGGIKTTTLAVMLAALPALIRNQPRALLLRRTIPHDIVYRAATIMTVATMVTVLVTFLLLATHDMPFEKVVFEAVSALATVGLSIGATGELNAFGKWLIIMTHVHRPRRTDLARPGPRLAPPEPDHLPRGQGSGDPLPPGNHLVCLNLLPDPPGLNMVSDS
jgi:hypothetical protein